MLKPRLVWDVPEETARVAQIVFAKGNDLLLLRDELGVLYQDTEFFPLFAWHGQVAESPGLLALITILQFSEGLTDRQAVLAVQSRIDWKYVLGLELTDAGFHYSVLSEFRQRLIEGGMEMRLLDDMLHKFKEKKLLKIRGPQRTDSTRVLAAIRKLNRLECVGETIRRVLNDLATVVPTWLKKQITKDWFDLYVKRFENYRLPKAKTEQSALADRIGSDGHHLLQAIYREEELAWLAKLESVEIMRQVWIQQYMVCENKVKWRTKDDLPPNKLLIQSPYDPQARNQTKRRTNWTGYVVHLTETCATDMPRLITHVESRPATISDGEMIPIIHEALAKKDLLPDEHFVDTGYIDAEHLANSQTDHDIELYGPAPQNTSWQAKSPEGFDISCFKIDWETETIICPQGKINHSWRSRADDYGNPSIEVRFRRADCLPCKQRAKCTKSKTNARTLRLRPQKQHEALIKARERQNTSEFKEKYKIRAGVESTMSQGARAFGLRRSRYIGLPKTHLQHVATAGAINLTRMVAWLKGKPKGQTRVSRFAALAPKKADADDSTETG